jgi:SOS-response transcriptional repressor LexA
MQTQEIEIAAELNSPENSPYIDHVADGGSFYGVNGWCRQYSPMRLAPASVNPQTVVMQDDSMTPTFEKGAVVIIDYDVIEEPGDCVLIRFGHLLLIRRYTDRGDNDHFDFIPENPAYPLVLDDGTPDPWGVVSAVQHVDGSIETFDLSTRRKANDWEMGRAVSSPAA